MGLRKLESPLCIGDRMTNQEDASVSVAMSEILSLWNDTPAKKAIINYVNAVTNSKNPDFVPQADRIATFDNDGTLWCEKPMYIQLDFILRRWVEMANENPALEEQPWKAAVEKDYAWLGNAVTNIIKVTTATCPP